MEPLAGQRIRVSAPSEADLAELASVARQTFPLACPPGSAPPDIVAFIDEHLSEDSFRRYLADATRVVLTARDEERILGYVMLIGAEIGDDDVRRAVTPRPAVELSKMYVLPDRHGAGISAALMHAALHRARDRGAACVWLGVNRENQRAQRFYGKNGFTVVGTKSFRLGTTVESDYVMVRLL